MAEGVHRLGCAPLRFLYRSGVCLTLRYRAQSYRVCAHAPQTDQNFYCDSRLILDAAVNRSQPAFSYRLLRTPYFLKLDPCLGVPHLSDVIFLFGNFDAILERTERDLGARMRAYWTQFAKHHTPGGSWPAYGGERRYLDFNAPGADGVGQQWKQEQCDILDSIDR